MAQPGNSRIEVIKPDWPAPEAVQAFATTRRGGVSAGAYQGLNLALHVQDDISHVAKNREILADELRLPAEPVWLNQVHSARVIKAGVENDFTADAAWTDQPGVVCAVLTADCLPVFLCDDSGSSIGLAHAGWRGLHAGIITATVKAMTASTGNLMAWLGPAIGPQAFEVGVDVYDAFVATNPANTAAFVPAADGHWLCNIYKLAQIELTQLGITRVFGGGLCTWSDPARFYSYRRRSQTGRQASLIWITNP